MIRVLLFLVLAGAAAYGAVWVADVPGRVSVVWFGWRIETTAVVLVAAAAIAALLAMIVLRILRAIWHAPRSMAEHRHAKRRAKGYKALTQGMVAVAAGDPDEAQRQARRAEVLLNEPPLTLLLSAQSAQLNGDDEAAKRFFQQMLERKETAFLGLRGLLRQSLDAGDRGQALRLAEQARALRPDAPWLQTALIELQAASGKWGDAQETLERAIKLKLVTGAAASRQMAAILVERARAAGQAGDAGAALDHARRAHKSDPDFAPAAAASVRAYGASGRARKAAKTARQAWERAPHPEVAAAFTASQPKSDALQRLRALEQLAAANPEHVESRVALAEAALAAQLWGEARRHLQALVEGAGSEKGGSARAFRLMAEIEKAEHGDLAAAERWTARALDAPPDPTWVCAKCGAEQARWSAVCPHCAAFASFEYRAPRHAAVLAVEPPRAIAAPAPIAAPAEEKPNFAIAAAKEA